MTFDQNTLLVLAGIGVGLLAGLVATLLQIRRDPETWKLLSGKPVASVPGSGSSVAVLILGFAFLMVGIVLGKNPVIMPVGAAVFAFGAIRYLFRYYRPL